MKNMPAGNGGLFLSFPPPCTIYNKKNTTMRHILTEGKNAEQLADAFVRNNPSLDKEGLINLLMADPTASRNDRGSFAGRYGVWIGNMYASGGIKPGDVPELKSALVTYDKNKTQLPPLKDCKSLSELIEWVKDLSDDFKPVRKQSKAKADLEKVYEDSEWVVYVPHSHAAARRGGEGTHWCTASEEPYYFNRYSKDGPLYINIRKSDGAKFQFHFESDQFMNADDEPVRLNEIGLSEGIIKFYNKINPLFECLMEYDHVGEFIDGFAIVKLNRKFNFINTDGKLLSDQWFDTAWDFFDGFAKVALKNKYNFLNTEGQFVSSQWFDWALYFNDGLVRVQLNHKWNFINAKGELLSELWFDSARDFFGSPARVELNKKVNFINKRGELLSKQWFDSAGNFEGGLASVESNGKWNYINKNGKLLSRQWFDWVGYFSNGFASVMLDEKYNLIDKEGLLLSDQWFDAIGNFFDGFALVKLNGKYNFINTKGQFLSKQWFDDAWGFNGEFARVKINGKWGKIDTGGNLTLFESRRTSSPIITESILHLTIAECVKRILSEK